jgi:peptidoglycan/LPS O-acetylase OafA/YrhL
VAILLVLCHHTNAPPASCPHVLRVGVEALKRVGWIGVDLFFVLSGFLVSGLLFQEFQKTGGIGVGRFLIRRGWKIYPGFYLLLFMSLLGAWAMHALTPALGVGFLREAVYLRNYAPLGTTWGASKVWDHTWSLDIEEHFYLALVLVLCCSVVGTSRFAGCPPGSSSAAFWCSASASPRFHGTGRRPSRCSP